MEKLNLKDIHLMANTSLRLISKADTNTIFKWFSDDQVVKYLPYSKVNSPDDTLNLIQKIVAINPEKACSYIVSEHQKDIGFLTLRRTNKFSLCIATSLLDKNYWGTGKALDILNGYINHFIKYDEIYRIWAICHLDNKYSSGLMEKAGMIQEGILRRGGFFPNLASEPNDVYLYSFVK